MMNINEVTELRYRLRDVGFDLVPLYGKEPPVYGRNNKYGSLTGWQTAAGAPPEQIAMWARMVSEAGSFYPPAVIEQYEKGETFPSMVGDVHFRPEDHQLVRPVVIVKCKSPKDMKNKEDYWEVTEVVPGAPLMQKPDAFGCNLGPST